MHAPTLPVRSGVDALRDALAAFPPAPDDRPADGLATLVRRGMGRLPMPAAGATLRRWQALAAVAQHDLSLAKLYEGHTDALAILHELGASALPAFEGAGKVWGMWAAEPPQGRVTLAPADDGQVLLDGTKCWCSGAAHVSHGLLTAWWADGTGPQLVAVAMQQPGIAVRDQTWHAIGMAASASLDVAFHAARGVPVGKPGDYLSRPGFWQGGAGVAACWYGGALALAEPLRAALRQAATASPPRTDGLREAALGKVDLALRATATLLREAANWIDANPRQDASEIALRVRLAAEDCARRVLDEVGRALGATPFCRDAHFARAAADLPVFVRQSHAERDFAALGQRVCTPEPSPWTL